MGLSIFFDLMSQPSRALILFVRLNKIPCKEVAVALRKGEHKTEEYAQINPFQKVPCIDHDGFKLTESVAILRYLSQKFPVGKNWYPEDIQKRARVDEYMSWQHLNLRLFGSMYFQQQVVIPLMKGQPPNEKSVARFQAGLETVLEQMEQIWLKENPYICGKEMTIADLLAVTELEQPGMAGYDVRKGRPIIQQYMDKVKSEINQIDNENQYDKVHSVVYKVSKKYSEAFQSKL